MAARLANIATVFGFMGFMAHHQYNVARLIIVAALIIESVARISISFTVLYALLITTF